MENNKLQEVIEVAIEAGLAAAITIGATSLGWLSLEAFTPVVTAGLTILFAAIYEFAVE
jgi:hypothetical protein